jgi:hypothetical protein
MTDPDFDSRAYYLYRGATNPGRPALVIMTTSGAIRGAIPFEENGLAMFVMNDAKESVENIPDSTPDGIPRKSDELAKMPKYVKTVKCNGGGKQSICFMNKWSCTDSLQQAGVDCVCPHVGKRTSWHMG